MIKKRLLNRPYPDLQEGLSAYILRLAEGNGLRVKDLIGSQRTITTSLRSLLLLTAETEDRYLRSFSPQLVPDSATWVLWNRRCSRYCPQCLLEHNTWKQEWELNFVTACPVHKSQLMDTCKCCGAIQKYNRQQLNYCDCGSALSSSKVAPAVPNEINFSQLMIDKLHGKTCRLPHVESLSLQQLNRVAYMLAGYEIGNKPARAFEKVEKIAHVKNARAYTLAGANILLQWPTKYHEMLGRINSASQDLGVRTIAGSFGTFYKKLYLQFMDSCYFFLREEFESYIEKNWKSSLAERNKRLSYQARRSHPWKSLGVIARELNASRNQIKQVIEAEQLDTSLDLSKAGRELICVNCQDLPKIKRALDADIDLKAAAKILGLQKKRMLEFLSSDSLKLLDSTKAPDRPWKIRREAIASILKLVDGLPVLNNPEAERFVSLGFAIRYWIKAPYLLPELIHAVRNKEIQPAAILNSRSMLSDWIFESIQLRRWIDQQLHNRKDGARTISEAAKYLHMNQTAFYHLVSAGFCMTVSSPEARCPMVTLAMLTKFSEKYIWGTELSTKLAQDWRSLHSWLSVRHVVPVSGPKIDGGVVNLYERVTVMQVLAPVKI